MPTGALKLTVPSVAEQEPMVAIPTRLPMGLAESPPAFSPVTVTIADLMNEALESNPSSIPSPHPFESAASTHVPLKSPEAQNEFPMFDSGPIQPPLAYIDV